MLYLYGFQKKYQPNENSFSCLPLRRTIQIMFQNTPLPNLLSLNQLVFNQKSETSVIDDCFNMPCHPTVLFTYFSLITMHNDFKFWSLYQILLNSLAECSGLSLQFLEQTAWTVGGCQRTDTSGVPR